MRKWTGLSPEATRRVVHAGVALFVSVTPWLFQGPALIYVLAVLFVVLNAVALKKSWFEGIHGTERKSWGTITMPLVLIPTLWIAWTLDAERVWALQVAFLILALADPMAAWVGHAIKHPRHFDVGEDTKTVAGSIAFFFTTLLLGGGALAWFYLDGVIGWEPWQVAACALALACVATATEALSVRGWDNFFIVLAVLLVLVYFDEHPDLRNRVLFGTGVGVGFAILMQQLRVLSLTGCFAGGLLAMSLLSMKGMTWAIPAAAFLGTSVYLSIQTNSRKVRAELITEKGKKRDAGQVFANGGVAWLLLVLYSLFPIDVFYYGFLGAFAAATADTWATELGTLVRVSPRLITSGRRVPIGTSGGVTWTGTVAAIAGAMCIGYFAWKYVRGPERLIVTAAVVGSGFVGTLVDSVLGATVQARFKDQETGKETERDHNILGHLPLKRGYRWIRNDQVNWACTAVGALLTMAAVSLL